MAMKVPPAALEAAIDWMVLLRSGEADAADAERHRAWCAADAQHATAWAHVQGAVHGTVDPLRVASAGPRAAAQAALARPPRRRRAILSVCGLAAGGLAAAWLAQRTWPAAVSLADLRSGVGERRSVTLADGSRLQLNAGSAVDVDFDADARVLHLQTGELIVQVAPDARRPFIVRSAEGSVRALGTRFLVRQEEGRTLAMVLQHSVSVRPSKGSARALQAGQAAYFSSAFVDEPQGGLRGMAAWEQGMLVANDRPLEDVVAALRPYRRGFIRLSPRAARLPVLGVFPLDDTDRVLESLEQTLPIRITRYGGWLVAIDLQP